MGLGMPINCQYCTFLLSVMVLVVVECKNMFDIKSIIQVHYKAASICTIAGRQAGWKAGQQALHADHTGTTQASFPGLPFFALRFE